MYHMRMRHNPMSLVLELASPRSFDSCTLDMLRLPISGTSSRAERDGVVRSARDRARLESRRVVVRVHVRVRARVLCTVHVVLGLPIGQCQSGVR